MGNVLIVPIDVACLPAARLVDIIFDHCDRVSGKLQIYKQRSFGSAALVAQYQSDTCTSYIFLIGVSIAIYIDRYAVPYGVAIGFFAFLISIGMMVDHANAYAVLFTFSISIFLIATANCKPLTIFNNAICKALVTSSICIYATYNCYYGNS